VLAATLGLAKHMLDIRAVDRAGWQNYQLRNVSGQTLGIGELGKAIAQRAMALAWPSAGIRRPWNELDWEVSHPCR
jgi:phosphoglycerate dehydrogenase-like enzyme